MKNLKYYYAVIYTLRDNSPLTVLLESLNGFTIKALYE